MAASTKETTPFVESLGIETKSNDTLRISTSGTLNRSAASFVVKHGEELIGRYSGNGNVQLKTALIDKDVLTLSFYTSEKVCLGSWTFSYNADANTLVLDSFSDVDAFSSASDVDALGLSVLGSEPENSASSDKKQSAPAPRLRKIEKLQASVTSGVRTMKPVLAALKSEEHPEGGDCSGKCCDDYTADEGFCSGFSVVEGGCHDEPQPEPLSAKPMYERLSTKLQQKKAAPQSFSGFEMPPKPKFNVKSKGGCPCQNKDNQKIVGSLIASKKAVSQKAAAEKAPAQEPDVESPEEPEEDVRSFRYSKPVPKHQVMYRKVRTSALKQTSGAPGFRVAKSSVPRASKPSAVRTAPVKTSQLVMSFQMPKKPTFSVKKAVSKQSVAAPAVTAFPLKLGSFPVKAARPVQASRVRAPKPAFSLRTAAPKVAVQTRGESLTKPSFRLRAAPKVAVQTTSSRLANSAFRIRPIISNPPVEEEKSIVRAKPVTSFHRPGSEPSNVLKAGTHTFGASDGKVEVLLVKKASKGQKVTVLNSGARAIYIRAAAGEKIVNYSKIVLKESSSVKKVTFVSDGQGSWTAH